MSANSKPAATRAPRRRQLAFLGVLALLGAVYALLPASWFRIDEPTMQVEPPPKPADLQELAAKAKASPSDPIARSRYGFALAANNREREAEDELRAAVRLAPRNPSLWYNLGVFYLNSDHALDAEKAFRRMGELVPGDAKVHLELGLALEADGKLPEAHTHFQLASAIDPGAPEPRLWLAILEAYNKPPEKLLEELRQDAEKISHPDIAYYLLARSFMRHERWDEAIQFAQMAIKRKPNDFGYCHALGQIYLRAHRYNDARPALEKALSLYDRSAVAHYEVGIIDLAQHRPKQAAQHFDKSLAADPQLQAVYRYAIIAYRQLGNETKCRELEKQFREMEYREQKQGYKTRHRRKRAFL